MVLIGNLLKDLMGCKMPKYISVSLLDSEDYKYLMECFCGSRVSLMKNNGCYYAVISGDSKKQFNMEEEIEGELVSLGANTLDTVIYWNPGYKG